MINKNEIPFGLEKILNKYIADGSKNITILRTINTYNLKYIKKSEIFINLEKVNNFRHINEFHESVNDQMKKGSLYCCIAETMAQRKYRKLRKHFPLIKPFVLLIDFIFKRVIPKLPLIKKLYFALTRGHNRVMSETEIVGRLVSCGFKIKDSIDISGLTYYVTEKVRGPYFDMNPSYGPIFKMKRIGYKGEIISVYKFRTMSPYSEYIQKDIISKNKFDSTGKVKDDFRVTYYGKFLRKYWIDEFPMFLNWFKRELKLVGVRPLSEDYYSRYPKDLKDLRIKTKPGLIPPYYVDLPVTFDEICDSERKYLKSYFLKPIKTDIQYFFHAFWNIFIKGRRSS